MLLATKSHKNRRLNLYIICTFINNMQGHIALISCLDGVTGSSFNPRCKREEQRDRYIKHRLTIACKN